MRSYLKIVLASSALSFAAVPASALVVVGSSAYGISVNLRVANIVTGSLGPIAGVGDETNDDTSYSLGSTGLTVASQTFVLSTVAGLQSRLGIGTGLITTTAIGGPSSGQAASSSALVNGLALSLSTRVAGVTTPILSLGASTVKSTAAAGATPNATATGTTSIENLTLGLAGINIPIGASVFLSTTPDTNLLNFLGLSQLTGLRIMLNEQVKTGDGVSDAGITVNAIHLIFNNYLIGTRLLSGDIVVSRSIAYITDANSATPEPATWLQMITGFGLTGLIVRRRRQREAA